MVTEEEQSKLELASEMIPVPSVPQVPQQQKIHQVPEQKEIQPEEETNPLADVHRSKKSRTRKKTLHANIRKQMEFYFSDANLSRDRFLANLVNKDPSVDLNVFLQFNKIRALTNDTNRIAKALQDSTMLKVSEDGTKVYRTTPVGIKDNSEECTVYVQRLPSDADHEMLNKIFSQYGSISYISIPKYRQSQNIKGFAFVEFDKAEDAVKCLQAFREKGYELPSETSPSHVLSITTYNENDNKEDNTSIENNVILGEEGEVIKTEETKSEDECCVEKGTENEQQMEHHTTKKSRKRSANEPLNLNTEEENVKRSKKMKKANVGENTKENKKEKKNNKKDKEGKFEEEERKIEHTDKKSDICKKNKMKRKMIDESDDSQVHSAKEISADTSSDRENDSQQSKSPNKGRKRRNTIDVNNEEDEEIVPKKKLLLENEESEINESINQKKKNRHRNHKKSEKIDATDLGLQVMAKKDWKKLRNKYLDLQKSKMRQLKQHLFKTWRNQRSNSEKNKIENNETEDIKNSLKQSGIRDLTLVPGLIVKVEMDQPCVDVQTFKKELKDNSSVKYVDISEGATLAYVRFDTSEAAKEMTQKSTQERKMTLIEDDEEKWYWNKMMADRNEKLSKKLKVNQRGRNKLLKKAEKTLGKHIKFDEV